MEAELLGLALEDLHEEHVVVCGEGRVAVDRGHLVLGAGHLVVQHRHRHTEFQHHLLHIEHQLVHLRRRRRKVVQLRLLVAGGELADERAAAIHQVRPLPVELGAHDEELLLPTQEGVDDLRVRADLDVLQEAQALLVQSVVGAKQRRLVVDACPEVGDEGARNPQHLVEHEALRGAVPRRECRRGVRGAEAAVREGGAVRLSEEEALVGQGGLEGLRGLLRRPVEVDHRVHLAGAAHAARGATAATDREEPVREAHGALLARPSEHGLGDGLHVLLARRRACDERLAEAAVDAARQARLHRVVVEDGAGHVRELIPGGLLGREHGHRMLSGRRSSLRGC
mmetsp:Transcript_83682/g.234440  ORF Transcript_83682/g.234440 Transcript_83682/m.234440 type:complete len:340 (+) Transcript_83682:1482-2501(+)